MRSPVRRPLRLADAIRIWRPSGRLRAEVEDGAAAFGRAPVRLGQKEAEERVANTAAEMREQALKVFETYVLVLDWVEDRTRELGWSHIAHDQGFHQFLSDLSSLPQITAVRVIGADGQVRASGRFFP